VVSKLILSLASIY